MDHRLKNVRGCVVVKAAAALLIAAAVGSDMGLLDMFRSAPVRETREPIRVRVVDAKTHTPPEVGEAGPPPTSLRRSSPNPLPVPKAQVRGTPLPIPESPKITGSMMTKFFEGFEDRPYIDSRGVPTIGYGFNMNDKYIRTMLPPEVLRGEVPLDRSLADSVFDRRYRIAVEDAREYLGEILDTLPEGKRDVIVDMSYNLGLTKLSDFAEMKKALLAGDMERASAEMKDSKWYRQTGRRGKNHIYQIINGVPLPHISSSILAEGR